MELTPWKDSLEFIRRHFLAVCVTSLLYVLPIQLVVLLLNGVFPLFLSSPKMIVIDEWTLFFGSLLFLQVPFILLVQQVEEVGELSIADLLRSILDRFWELSAYFFLFILMVHFSMYLLFIPGAALYILFLLLPYTLLWERRNWKYRLKLAWDLGFEHLGKCIMIFTLFVAFLNFIKIVSSVMMHYYASPGPGLLVIPLILGTVAYPLYSIYLTYRFLEWRENLEGNT